MSVSGQSNIGKLRLTPTHRELHVHESGPDQELPEQADMWDTAEGLFPSGAIALPLSNFKKNCYVARMDPEH